MIVSDSMYVISGLTEHLEEWEDKVWSKSAIKLGLKERPSYYEKDRQPQPSSGSKDTAEIREMKNTTSQRK